MFLSIINISNISIVTNIDTTATATTYNTDAISIGLIFIIVATHSSFTFNIDIKSESIISTFTTDKQSTIGHHE
jgi:hypothetical protein